MRRLAVLTAPWLFLSWCALAQSVLPGFPPGVFNSRQAVGGGGAVGYQGPIDAAGASSYAAWGLRCASAAYCGGNLANVCTVIATVDTCLNFASDATTGNLIIVTIGGLACGTVTCTVKILYDQSAGGNCGGNCDASQATVASRPILIPNCLGTLPCMRVAGGQSLATGGSAHLSQPSWVAAVVTRTGAFTSEGPWFGETGDGTIAEFRSSANSVRSYAGTNSVLATAADSAWHSVQSVFDGASSDAYVDGSANVGDAGADTIGLPLRLFTDTFGSFMTGDAGEIILWNPVSPSSGQKSAVCHNQFVYWGTSVSC